MREKFLEETKKYIKECLVVIERTSIMSKEEIDWIENELTDDYVGNFLPSLLVIEDVVNKAKNTATCWENKSKEE